MNHVDSTNVFMIGLSCKQRHACSPRQFGACFVVSLCFSGNIWCACSCCLVLLVPNNPEVK